MGFALGIIEVLKHEMNYHDLISYLISVHIECLYVLMPLFIKENVYYQ